MNPGPLVGVEHIGLGGRVRERGRDRPAARLLAGPAQALDPRADLLVVADPIRHPLVAVGEHPIEHAACRGRRR